MKDVHLIEAAVVLDQTIISSERRVRNVFAEAAIIVGELKDIIWVNPTLPEEKALDWLKAGAKADKERTLEAFSLKLSKPKSRRQTNDSQVSP